MKRRTKIVCTLGPAVDSRAKIKQLIAAGMNVARLNCSHGDWETRRRWIKWVRDLSPEIAPIAILADLQGPKFRIGILPEDGLHLTMGQSISVGPGPGATMPVNQPEIFKAFANGCRVLLGDGNVELKLGDKEGENFVAKVVSDGLVKSRQGITLVNRIFDVPPMTDKDREDIGHACAAGVDYIALSYVKEADDIVLLRHEVNKLDPSIGLCAKIETREAIQDLHNILKVVDLVMVARGDLGLQMDIEDVPIMQKKIIDMCTWAGKPVITATQMLESMIENPRPTRAEATDVANAVLDGTDAIMLSGETASGEYPIECVKTMVRIAEKAEPLFVRSRIEKHFQENAHNHIGHQEAIAHSVADLASLLKPAAVISTTVSGNTARLVSKYRPKAPLLCATYDERTQARLGVCWGVEAIRLPTPRATEEGVRNAVGAFVKHKRLKKGSLVLITAGVPFGEGNTNLILTQVVE
ncbi:MAG: pyruvate kinase [Chlorobia bacterium]|nr:pyruvate kinase [Fimbriimonadaceae bacterium]